MEFEDMKELALANARDARQLMGVPALTAPDATDAGFSLRERTLLRSLYPHAAPPPPPPPIVAEPGESHLDGSASTGRNAGALTTVASASPPHTTGGGGTLSSYASPANKGSLLSGAKRGRDGDGQSRSDDAPILSVNPKELKHQHALVIASSARDAVAGQDGGGAARAAYTPPPLWKLSKVLVGHQGWVWAAAVDPTNSWFATGGFDAVIKVWDLSSGALKMNLTGHKEAVRDIAVSANSPYMFSGSDDHAVKCWDLERNEVVREFFGHRSAVHCVAVHPTLDLVFSGGRDKTVRVWDIRTRACVHTLDGHTDSVMSLAAQQGEPQLISGGSDGMIYLWDVASGRPFTRLSRHTKPVRGLSITPSGSGLVSCGADEIRFWKLPAGDFECNASTIVERPNVAGKPSGGGNRENHAEELAYRWSCCAISPRGVLAVGSQDGHLGFFDTKRPQSRVTAARFYCPYQLTKTKSIPGTLAGEGGVNRIVYDASGTRLITAESDKSVKIWRLHE